jgi:N-carbamoyl-L-amino-acid hydrolase
MKGTVNMNVFTSTFAPEDRKLAEQLFSRIGLMSSTNQKYGGITRPSYSAVETAALNEIEATARRSDLETWTDSAANLWVDPHQIGPIFPTICIGSHIDSVPNGGNFDGLAGIVAGLLVVRRLAREKPNAGVRLIAFRGEESAWFGMPYVGAKALLGQLTKEDLTRRNIDDDRSLYEHMRGVGADVTKLGQSTPLMNPKNITEYWELHIEQGPVLVEADKPLGVVTDIRGNIRHREIVIRGEAGHSGTTPRRLRKDAVAAFVALMSRLDGVWQRKVDETEDLVVTCGRVSTGANASITQIADEVRFCLEWRSLSEATLTSFDFMLKVQMDFVRSEFGVEFEMDAPAQTRPAKLSTELAIRSMYNATVIPGVLAMKMPSGAGHDAALFANAGIPTGMLFVRNEHGSHNPREAMTLDDFMIGVEVLYQNIAGRV